MAPTPAGAPDWDAFAQFWSTPAADAFLSQPPSKPLPKRGRLQQLLVKTQQILSLALEADVFDYKVAVAAVESKAVALLARLMHVLQQTPSLEVTAVVPSHPYKLVWNCVVNTLYSITNSIALQQAAKVSRALQPTRLQAGRPAPLLYEFSSIEVSCWQQLEEAAGWMQSAPALLCWFLEQRPPGFPVKLTMPLWSFLAHYLNMVSASDATPVQLGLISSLLTLTMEYQQALDLDPALSKIAAQDRRRIVQILFSIRSAIITKFFWGKGNGDESSSELSDGSRKLLLPNPALEYSALVQIAGLCQFAQEQQQKEQQQASRATCNRASSRSSREGSGQSSFAQLVVPPDHELVAAAVGKAAVAAQAAAVELDIKMVGPVRGPHAGLNLGVRALLAVWEETVSSRQQSTQTTTAAAARPPGAAAAAAVRQMPLAALGSGPAAAAEALGSPPAAVSSSCRFLSQELSLRLLLEALALGGSLGEKLGDTFSSLAMPLQLLLLIAQESGFEDRKAFIEARGPFLLEVFAQILKVSQQEQQGQMAYGQHAQDDTTLCDMVVQFLAQCLHRESDTEVALQGVLASCNPVAYYKLVEHCCRLKFLCLDNCSSGSPLGNSTGIAAPVSYSSSSSSANGSDSYRSINGSSSSRCGAETTGNSSCKGAARSGSILGRWGGNAEQSSNGSGMANICGDGSSIGGNKAGNGERSSGNGNCSGVSYKSSGNTNAVISSCSSHWHAVPGSDGPGRGNQSSSSSSSSLLRGGRSGSSRSDAKESSPETLSISSTRASNDSSRCLHIPRYGDPDSDLRFLRLLLQLPDLVLDAEGQRQLLPSWQHLKAYTSAFASWTKAWIKLLQLHCACGAKGRPGVEGRNPGAAEEQCLCSLMELLGTSAAFIRAFMAINLDVHWRRDGRFSSTPLEEAGTVEPAPIVGCEEKGQKGVAQGVLLVQLQWLARAVAAAESTLLHAMRRESGTSSSSTSGVASASSKSGGSSSSCGGAKGTGTNSSSKLRSAADGDEGVAASTSSDVRRRKQEVEWSNLQEDGTRENAVAGGTCLGMPRAVNMLVEVAWDQLRCLSDWHEFAAGAGLSMTGDKAGSTAAAGEAPATAPAEMGKGIVGAVAGREAGVGPPVADAAAAIGDGDVGVRQDPTVGLTPAEALGKHVSASPVRQGVEVNSPIICASAPAAALPKRLSVLPKEGLPAEVVEQLARIISKWPVDGKPSLEHGLGGDMMLSDQQQKQQLLLLRELLQLGAMLLAVVPMTFGCSNPACVSLVGASEVAVSCKACTGCNAVCYCSRACQVDHWKAHKKLCKKLKQKT